MASKVPKTIKPKNVDKAKANNVANKTSNKSADSSSKNLVTNAIKGTVIGGAAVTAASVAPGLYQAASGVVSSVKKAATIAGELLDPEQAIKRVEENNTGPSEELQFPLGRDAELTCWMHITAFKYIYDKNDIPGNRRILDSELKTQVKKLYTVKLPLPGDISTEFSAHWSDYTSVWSKIVRASNVAEGQEFDMEQFKTRIAELVGSGALEDATKVGMMSGLAGLINGAGIGGSAGSAISDALTYLKVAGGISINPMSQAKYTGHEIKDHSFQFNFMPRNRQESLAAMKIIEKFEDSIHGEKSNALGGILMNYPDMFNIRFTGPKGEVIPGIIEIPDCHLTQVNINRSTGTTGFKITKDYNPINYTLSITFKEAQNLIRDDLKFLRQSAEQAQALHSGKELPKEWNPNELLKDIKPFEVATVSGDAQSASGESESSGNETTNDNISSNAGGVPVSPEIASTIQATVKQSADALVKGLTHEYKTQGKSNPELEAAKDVVKIFRNHNHKDYKAVAANVGIALKDKHKLTRDDIGNNIGSEIDKQMKRLANSYENQVTAYYNTSSKYKIPGTNTTIEVPNRVKEIAKKTASSAARSTPIGLAIETVSQVTRAVNAELIGDGKLDNSTGQTINGMVNVFNTKMIGRQLQEWLRK